MPGFSVSFLSVSIFLFYLILSFGFSYTTTTFTMHQSNSISTFYSFCFLNLILILTTCVARTLLATVINIDRHTIFCCCCCYTDSWQCKIRNDRHLDKKDSSNYKIHWHQGSLCCNIVLCVITIDGMCFKALTPLYLINDLVSSFLLWTTWQCIHNVTFCSYQYIINLRNLVKTVFGKYCPLYSLVYNVLLWSLCNRS